ncbi:hypothetical protein, partial [Bradyrhizobium elkanii]|uniref:hypothetical protein n=1 Tax=Bradyrhizobium elkanii TaxID=29448 RepID=UPI001AEBB1C6
SPNFNFRSASKVSERAAIPLESSHPKPAELVAWTGQNAEHCYAYVMLAFDDFNSGAGSQSSLLILAY